MAAGWSLQAIVGLVDQASGPLKTITAALGSVLGRATAAAGAVAAIGRTPGVARIGGALQDAAGAAGQLGGALGGLLAPLSAVGAAMSVGGAAAFVQHYAAAATEVARVAERLGVGAERWQELGYAASTVGVDVEQLEDGLKTLNEKVAEVATGQNQDLAALFEKMGVSARDSAGNMRPAADLLPELAEAFRTNTNAALRTKMAVELFGDEAGARLIPLLAGGSDGLAALSQRAHELGLVMSGDAVSAGARFGRTLATLQQTAAGLGNAVGAKVLPILEPLVARLAAWAEANREVIATKVAGWIEEVGRTLAEIDWQGVIDGARAFARTISELVERIGGWKVAAIGLLALINAPLIGAVVGLVAALAKLVFGVGGVGLALGKLVFGPVIAGLGAFANAMKIGQGALMALRIAFAASPFGLILTLVTALAAGGWALYENWDGIDAFFQTIWTDIKAAFADTAVGRTVADLVAGAKQLFDGWNGLDTFFQNIWDGIKSAFDAVGIKVSLEDITAAAAVLQNAWAGTKKFFADLWAEITGVFQGAMERIKPVTDWLQRQGEALGLVDAAPKVAATVEAVAPAAREYASAASAAGANLGAAGGAALRGAAGPSPIIAAVAATGTAGGPATAAAPAAPDQKITVDFRNVPQGLRVQQSGGGAAKAEVAVGYASPFAGP